MSEQESDSRLRAVGIELAKVVGAAAYSALLFAPHAAEHAVETTKVETHVADFPAELSFNPGDSRLDILNQATFHVPKNVHGVGIRANITGLPHFTDTRQITSYFSPKRLDVYASLADSPRDAIAGPKELIERTALRSAGDYELLWGGVGTIGIYGGLTMLRLRNRAQKAEGKPMLELGWQSLAGLAIAGMAGSLTIVDYNHQVWADSAPQASNLTEVSALKGTSLEGTTIDNPFLLTNINNGIRYAARLKERRTVQREQYLATAQPELSTQLGALPDLRDNEQLIFVMTDMHSGKAGTELARTAIQTLQQRYGKDTLPVVLNIGDMSYAATFQRQSVMDQAFKDLPVKVVVTRGNHDVGPVPRWIKESGVIDTTGYASAEGLSIYGKPDVEHTPFLEDSSFDKPGDTEETLGEAAGKALAEKHADVLDLHEPDAIAAALGIPSMSQYLHSREDTKLTTCDYEHGTITGVPFALANAGHWHDQYPIKMICNADGTWGVVNVQGTGGGANESPTINDWSDPDGKPVKQVSFRVFMRNTKYDSITGYMNIEVGTDGTVHDIHRIDIGTSTGAPFPTPGTTR